MMKKTVFLILAAVMILTASIAAAKTVEPESTETDGLAGVTVHATVGEYDMEPINAAVEKEVKKFLKRLASKPREALVEAASARNEKSYQAALEQAEKEYAIAQKQMNALEEEAVKALTGESQLDLSVVNTMIIKHRARRDAAEQAIEEARERLEQEQITNKETQAQIDEMLSWVDCYAKANVETKHMIISRIIERVEIKARNKIHIKFKISLDQFMGKET